MQASRHYEISEVPQYLVGRVPTSIGHMFHLSHEISLSPTSGHAHTLSQSPHLQHQHHLQHQFHRNQYSPHQAQPQQAQHQPHLVEHQTQLAASQPKQPHAPMPQQQHYHPAQQQQHNRESQQQQHQALAPDSPEAGSPIASRISPKANYTKALVVKDQSITASEDHDRLVEESERGTTGNRWPRQETLALLKIRSDMDVIFKDSSLKGPLWEEVSRKLSDMGYHRNAKKCKEKFENVHKYYKRTRDGKTGRQDGKNYRFYSQLEALYGNINASNNAEDTDMHNRTTCGRNGGDGVGNGLPNSQADREGLLLSRGTAVGTNGQGERAGFAHPEFNYSSSLNFSSDSSGDDFENPAESENPENRKRKRKSLRRLMLFFENLMKKFLDKQEEMQHTFLEALERREQDRMIRDEAWKREEMIRLNREHELRAQERSLAATRDAALVAFLQKVTGETLQLPQIAIPVQPLSTASDIPEDHHDEKDSFFFDPNSKRWPKAEVLAFIKLRSAMEPRFHEPGPKSLLWEEISSLMASFGYNRSAKRCKEKWENINKYFKKAKEGNKKRSENAKTCPYFHQLDTLYSKGLLGSHKQLVHKVEDNPDEVMEEPSGSNREDDSGQAQGHGDSEILAIKRAGDDNTTVGTCNSNVSASHFFCCPENGRTTDGDTSHVNAAHNTIDTSFQNLPVVSHNFDGLNNTVETSTTMKTELPYDQEKETKADMQVQAGLSEDYEKTNLEEDSRRADSQQRQLHLIIDRQTSSNREASVMALVHKFSDDPEEYSIAGVGSGE